MVPLQIRNEIQTREAELRSSRPELCSYKLLELNAEATKNIKNEDYVGALAVYYILFARSEKLNLTHPELYVCHSNASAAYLKLEMYEEALDQAVKCAQLAEQSFRR